MRLPIISRSLFALAIIVAGLVMASCAMPAAQPPAAPATQPPVTVLVVVTATPLQPAVVSPTGTATNKPAVVEPTTTPTSKPPTAGPSATSTSQPPTVRPSATSTSKPPTLQPSPTQTRAPTRTSTPPPSATPAPHTRTLYGDQQLLKFMFPPNPIGAKGDTLINVLKLLPSGCEIVDAKALDFHLGQIQLPPQVTAEHKNTAFTGHGWSVARTSPDPRDLGVKIHWWYDPANMIDLRIVYTVREPWNVDCNVPGLTQLEP